MFKKIISCILAITLILAIVPVSVVSAASSTIPQNMLYINTSETGKRLYQRAVVEVGETYYFSFGISSDIVFNPLCRTDGSRNAVNANITQLSKGVKGDVTIYEYSYTIPETDNNGNAMTDSVFFGIQISSGCEGYFFDASVYNAADESKTELLENPDFSEGVLDRWAWDWDVWFAASVHSTSNVGVKEWTNEAGTTTLRVVPFDDALLVDENAVPKMLYINTTAPERLMALADVKVGETYYFNFTLTSDVAFTALCRTNGSRYAVDASIKQVSAVVKGKCTQYTYSYTIPEKYTNNNVEYDMTSAVFFGIKLKNASECYFFDVSVYNANDKYKCELLTNSNFASGFLDSWAWDWKAWFINGNAGIGLTEWSDDATTLRVVDYDENLLMKDDTSAKMLYINTSEKGKEIYQRAVVEVGETYYFSFTLSKDVSFIALCRTDSDRQSISADKKLISKSYNGSCISYTYSFTIPETYTKNGVELAMPGSVFFGIQLSTAYEGYFFNTSVYNAADDNKTELFENPDFACGALDRWAWGWEIWFAATANSTSNVGVSEWTDEAGTTTLKIVKFDKSVFAENVKPTKMLYIKTLAAGKVFYQRANVIAGETYHFSFALSSNIKFTPICCADDSRPSISADIQQISKASKGEVTIYTYSYTLPETADVTDLVFFGIRLTEACEGYFFDASIKQADDELGFEFLENPDFSSGTMNKWALGWDKWFGSSDSVWSSDTAELRVIDFDNSILNPVPEKMLYINTSTSNKLLYQRATVEVGKTYYFSFTVNSNMAFTPVCFADDLRPEIDANIQLVSAVSMGSCTDYTYSYTIPETDKNGKAVTKSVFFGIRLTNPTQGYFFDVALYDPDDKYEVEMFENPDFACGALDRWALGWDIWFAPSVTSTANVGISEWTDGKTTLKVVDYNEDLVKTMLHVRYESVDMEGESLIQKIEGLEADTEYTISFDYNFVSGALDEAVNFVLIGDPFDPDKLVERVIQSSVENSYVTSTTDSGVNVTYTFALNSETVEKYQAFYAGFFFKITPRIVTEFYVSDFVIYKSNDADKTNLFVKDSFEDMYGWQSNWKAATEGSKTFGWDSVDYLDYLAEYVPYDAELFMTENAVVHYGDINFDGVINLRDLVALKKHIANLGEYISNLDCNMDGEILADDLTVLRKHIIGSEPIVWEDCGISSLMAVENLSGGADTEALALKNQINSIKDTLLTASTSNVYYVSEDGEYANNGNSPETSINIEKLRKLTLSEGDTVLFKRGDTFRIGSALILVSNVSYGAYGSGDKPIVSGSLMDYADKALWTTEDGFIWQTEVISSNVGNIVFNGGEYVGFKKATLQEVNSDGDFYFDSENQVLYLYLRQLNPANYFNSIEIPSANTLLSKNSGKNITIENIAFKYAAVHGMNINNCSNIKITGCEFGWIGGGYKDGVARYGNAIQFWQAATDCQVTNNYIYQVYDAALTFQGDSAPAYTNLTYKNNLVEYTSMNFEFWGSETVTISDIDFSDNILRFAGYGFGGIQRSNKGNQAFILAWRRTYQEGNISNFNITNNIFDVANSYFFYATDCIDSLGISGNTYYQNGNSIYSITASKTVYATDLTSFETAIKEVDSEAVVGWLDN